MWHGSVVMWFQVHIGYLLNTHSWSLLLPWLLTHYYWGFLCAGSQDLSRMKSKWVHRPVLSTLLTPVSCLFLNFVQILDKVLWSHNHVQTSSYSRVILSRKKMHPGLTHAVVSHSEVGCFFWRNMSPQWVIMRNFLCRTQSRVSLMFALMYLHTGFCRDRKNFQFLNYSLLLSGLSSTQRDRKQMFQRQL